MGESKRKKLLVDAHANLRSELIRKFERLEIDYSIPGFYDDPNFLKEERRDPRMLESYAQWVIARQRTSNYDRHVREIMPKLADIMSARLDRHQWFGGCVAVTGMVTRFLERMGVWNAVMKGSIAVHIGGRSRHFAIVDEKEGPRTETGHYWLVAPPYDIVDLTLYHQRWRRGDDKFHDAAPKIILAERTEIIKTTSDDVIAPALRDNDPQQYLRYLPDQARIASIFPARKVDVGSTALRYVPSGATAPDGPMEEGNLKARQGVPAITIWNEDVKPAFGLR